MKRKKIKTGLDIINEKLDKDFIYHKLHIRYDCPSPKKLILAARLKLPLSERLDLIDHIDKCQLCASDFQLINSILKEELSILKKIKDEKS
jgi:hypothetical protein